MNESTQLNSELLSADARGRKHIPVAVFAVILIHVVLFLVLLIAAGCRSSARAKRNAVPTPITAEAQATAPTGQDPIALAQPAQSLAPASATALPQAQAAMLEPISASEPVVESQVNEAAAQMRLIAQPTPAAKKPTGRTTTKISPAKKGQFYVVKSGDTLGKIAKQHGVTIQAVRTANKMKGDLIFPGQKLQLSPVNAAQAQPKKKRSNEV